MRTQEEVANDFRRDLAELMRKHSVTNIRGYYEWTISGRDTCRHKLIVNIANPLPDGTAEIATVELPWETRLQHLVDNKP